MKDNKKFFYNFSREDKKTIKQRIVHLICLFLPVLCAFAGCFLSPLVWNLFSNKEVPEYFKLIITIIFFLIPTIVIFVKTRNANPVMKIRILDKKSEDSEEN